MTGKLFPTSTCLLALALAAAPGASQLIDTVAGGGPHILPALESNLPSPGRIVP